MSYRFHLPDIHVITAMVMALVLSACAGGPVIERDPVFYPPMPNPPRIQHLKSITALKDIGVGSSFSNFILGRERNESLVDKPYGVAMHKGKIYVVDTRGRGYVILDLEKKTRTLFTGGGREGYMPKPINITIDADGNKFVTDTVREQVLWFDAQDKFVKVFGTKGQFKPADVAIAGDRLYVSDLKHNKIQVLDRRSGKLLSSIPADPKNQEAMIQFPTNMAIRDGYLYVTDTGNFKVVKYTLDGKFVSKLGVVGTTLGHFARPKGIAVDKQGRQYVVDSAFENVQIFNKQGKLLLFFGGPGNYPEHLNLPADIYIDYDNVKYFQQYVAPGFQVEYVILVTSQFGANKLNVFGFGKMAGMDYSTEDQ